MAEGKEFVATITSKGQVTIPVEIREQLGLAARDKVIFRLGKGNRVEMEPLPMNKIEIGPFGPSADTTGYQPYDAALPGIFAGIKSII
jgi:AbrB family looped-hinge helix DNA binding protein